MEELLDGHPKPYATRQERIDAIMSMPSASGASAAAIAAATIAMAHRLNDTVEHAERERDIAEQRFQELQTRCAEIALERDAMHEALHDSLSCTCKDRKFCRTCVERVYLSHPTH